MARKAYTVHVIPDAHRAAANVVMAVVNGDDITSEAFSVPANATGNMMDPFTHYYGGMHSTEAWESVVSNLAENMVTPAGGWPANGISEAQAIAAAQAMALEIKITQDGTQPDQMEALTSVLTSLGLQVIG